MFGRLAACGAILSGALFTAGTSIAQDAGVDGPNIPRCDGLPNPLFLSGSTTFEATVSNFAVRFSAFSNNPFTVVYHFPGSCPGLDNVVNDKDIKGNARYYTLAGTSVVINTCALAPSGQKADVGISDVFYESCPASPATKPAPFGDFLGPVQAMVFVVPKANLSDAEWRYITAIEAQSLYGCGAGFTGNTTKWIDTTGNFCREPSSTTQTIVAATIGLPASAMVSPACNPTSGTTGMLNAVTRYGTPSTAIGFLSADVYDQNRMNLGALAFQAFGQTHAFYADSGAVSFDRANVRKGQYVIWGYEHMVTRVDGSGKPTKRAAADFIDYVNGTKTDPNIDPVVMVAKTGGIPLCAMKVKRSTDGGPLSWANDVTDPCHCAFEAAVTGGVSRCAGCTGTGTSTCAGGQTCHHGFCE